jgi:dTDP-4-amino-4,6-dideoxygalactose transaminase
MMEVKERLESLDIFPRRYFYPSLNKLPYVEYKACPVSEDISERILCLPLYSGLDEESVERIANLI